MVLIKKFRIQVFRHAIYILLLLLLIIIIIIINTFVER